MAVLGIPEFLSLVFSFFSFFFFLTQSAECNAQGQEICKYTDGLFHVILSPSRIEYETGMRVCAEYKWQYATVDSKNWQQAAEVIMQCTPYSVGIGSYAGYKLSDPLSCQYMQASGVFALSTNSETCSDEEKFVPNLPILCQDPLFKAKPEAVKEDNVAEAFKKEKPTLMQAKLERQEDFTTCKYTENGIYMMYGPYEQQEASDVCALNKMTLLEAQLDELPTINRIWNVCDPMDPTAWINSFDNITDGLCRFIYYQNEKAIWLMVSEGEGPCSIPSAMILCRKV